MYRPFRHPLRASLALCLTIATAGCATKASYPGDRVADTAVIVVNNANTVHSSLTVHLLAPDGERRRLGTVNLNETRTFTVRRSNLSGTYQLLAEPLGQRDFRSHTFALSEGDAVEWNLRRNFVQYRGSSVGG